jgi:protein-S-isoprenylcysteine O-methyltransferase Ste14
MSLPVEAGLLAFAWALYFALHSVLAAEWTKSQVASLAPEAAQAYRITYNVLAVLMLLPMVAWILLRPSPSVWSFEGAAGILMDGLALAAVAGFLLTSRCYAMDEFLGLRQLRGKGGDGGGLCISPLHRYVRHPWYFLGLLLIWTRDMDLLRLTSALMITAYLVIGSRLEERKLVDWFGDVYRDYMARVPGLVPSPWHHLSPAEADALAQRAARRPPDAGAA